MTAPDPNKQRHRGCPDIDAIEVGLPLCGVSYGYGVTASETKGIISMTQRSRKYGSINLDQRF